MTDDNRWQAPNGPTPPVTPPAAGVNKPPASGSAVLGSATLGTGPAGAPPQSPAVTGWRPPPKPGLIPLRPLDLGTLLGASFRVLRRNPRPTFGVALLVQGIVTVVSLVVVGSVMVSSLLRLEMAAPEGHSAILAGIVGFSILSGILVGLLSFVANAWLQGIIVIEVAQATLGEKLTLHGLWVHAKGRFLALIGWSLLVGIVLVIAIGILVVAIVALVSTLGPLGIGLSVLVGIFGGLGLLFVGIWLFTKLSLVPSALMVERLRFGAAVAKSWSLTRGFFWKVFGIRLLVTAILGVAMSIISAPFSIVSGMLNVLVDPSGTGSQTAITIAVISIIVQLVIALILSAITAVISTAASALIYLDLRMRTEGLDLRLTSYVEAKQEGKTNLGNPYLPDFSLDTPTDQPAA